MDKLQAMDVFVNVVDTGSFTRAAENMQLPKATVSTLIRNLEQSLSVKLLNRTTRQISVTADGAAYYERCMRILADVREAEDALSKTRASPSGRLRIEVPSAIGRHLIIPKLPLFFERYPDIQLELGCTDRVVDMIEEGIDCSVRGGALADSTLIARRIGSLHFITCAAPSYIARFGRPVHPNDLLQHQCINFFSARTGKACEWDFARGDERITLRLPGRISLNDSNAYHAAALGGMGIAQIPLFELCPHVQAGEVELLLADWCVDPLPLHVVYPHNRHLSAKVRAFVDWVAELFAELEETQNNYRNCPLQGAAQQAGAEPLRDAVLEKVPA